MRRLEASLWIVFSFLLLASFGCKKRQPPVESGIATQTLHVGNELEPQELDPHIITGGSEIKILGALFEGLVGQHPEDLSPVPGAAESWTVSADKRIYRFKLREDLRWSNGDSLDSTDFQFSLKRMLNPKVGATNAYLLFVVKNAEAYYNGKVPWDSVGVKAPSNSVLELQLTNPTPYFLRLLSHPAWFPLHRNSLEKYGDPLGRASGWTQSRELVSNGPFKLVDWRVNEYVHVTKNPRYWDNQSSRLQNIIFYPFESRDAEERAFTAGQLHITDAVPVSKVGYYRKQNHPSLNIDPYLSTYFLRLNTSKKPLNDPRVRRALSIAINRSFIVETVTQGKQTPAWHFTPPGMDGYAPTIEHESNLTVARRLLADAGYPNGKGFPDLQYLYNTSENNKAIAVALQQMWKNGLGISVELINQEWKVLTQSRKTGEYDILRSSWIGDFIDPASFLEVWTSQSGNNFTRWSSAEYDHLLRQASESEEKSERQKHFELAEQLLMEAQPIIPVYFYTSVYMKHSSVKGHYPTLLNYHPWKHVYLEAVADP